MFTKIQKRPSNSLNWTRVLGMVGMVSGELAALYMALVGEEYLKSEIDN